MGKRLAVFKAPSLPASDLFILKFKLNIIWCPAQDLNLRCGILDYKTSAFDRSANRALKKNYTVSPYSLYTESRVLSVTIAIYSSYLLACSEKWSSVQDSNLRKLFASTLEGWRSTIWANTALKDMVRAVRFELTLILAPKASAIGQAKRRPDETIKTK